MVSDFIVLFPGCPFFELSEREYEKAVRAFPILDETKDLFLPRSATRFVELNGENYMDNEAILEQFERLFILLKFKEKYSNHDIEILVDNASTHTTKEFNISQIRKGNDFN